MNRPKKPPQSQDSEDAIMERMNKALKKMMETPHETQKEMIERRRRQEGAKASTPKSRQRHD